jgi:hypothetical protein
MNFCFEQYLYIFFLRLEEYVMLRTSNYYKHKPNVNINIPFIYYGSFQTQSTTTINDHHRFYSNIKTLRIYLIKKTPIMIWSSPLFQQINHLILQMPSKRTSLWNDLLDIGKKISQNECFTCYHR